MKSRAFFPWLAGLVLAWCATGGLAGEGADKKPRPLSPKELETLWDDLAGKDAAKAYRAIWAMVAAPSQSVPFLQARLKAVPGPKPGQIDRLIGELDSKRFTEREKAMVELEKLGPLATPALTKALESKPGPSLEMRRRIEKLLEKTVGLTFSTEELRLWRALEVLEHVGNPGARELLGALARGAPGAWQTEEARAALQRLARLKAVGP
jgi:hypothetical protein